MMKPKSLTVFNNKMKFFAKKFKKGHNRYSTQTSGTGEFKKLKFDAIQQLVNKKKFEQTMQVKR